MNRRWYYVCFILFIVIAALAGCGREEVIKNLNSKGKNIICFGDSLTRGEGASDVESYPAVLTKLINRQVLNAGASGETSGAALTRLDTDVLRKEPFLVIVELGGNDFLQRLPMGDTVKNVETIIAGSQNAGAAVALCDISSGFVMAGYRDKFRQLAKKTGSIFIEGFYDNILTNPDMNSDGINPNAKGYELLAGRVYKKLGEYFTFNPPSPRASARFFRPAPF